MWAALSLRQQCVHFAPLFSSTLSVFKSTM